MKETLEYLQDFFSTTDNIIIQQKLELLKLEIEREIIKAKIEAINEYNEKL